MTIKHLIFISLIIGLLGCNQPTQPQLIHWTSQSCDRNSNPYQLTDHISNIDTLKNTSFITINFSDNCCVEFLPTIEYKANRLILYPYQEYEGTVCECLCCFSIEYEIEGINLNEVELYFKDEKIEYSP